MPSVAVIGTGLMGRPIAQRLLDAGYDVTVWNRTAEKMKPLVDAGAIAATSPADAARRAGAVITMVSDPAALQSVTEDGDGVLDGATTIIQMSTVGPSAITRLQSKLASGTELLDSPVLGSVSEAESGSLRVFVGATPQSFETWSPLLSVLGSPVRVGGVGSGSAAKLVANSTLFGTLGILGEALELGKHLGLDSGAVFDVLASTPLAAQAQRRRTPVESGEFPVRFHMSLARKDIGLILDAASDAGADVRLARAAQTWFADAVDAGLGDRDYSAILQHILLAGENGP
ncbi:MAG: NAD(P)-dependent oxidoreductase [Actinobacteria bacterium]|nr:NAD(P)-dependent oxidoreductase [Actinomycetota bacterium]